MSDTNEDATYEPAAPKKNKGGRPRKAPDMNVVVAELREQLAVLQRAQLASQASTADRIDSVERKATLDIIPAASEAQPPGTYIKLGVDASGAPIMGKVRWNRDAIEKAYPKVTFVPMRDFTCGPHGILYRVVPGIETTVPSIVYDLYMGAMRTEKEMEDRYRPLSALERSEIDAQAAATPGVGVKSRFARVGAGLNVHAADDIAQAAKAAAEAPKQ